MNMIDLITVLSFGLTCFTVGYMVRNHDAEK